MRIFMSILCGGLVVAGILAAAGTTLSVRGATALPTAAGATGKAALGRDIREYLLDNPEVLVEAMQELERKQERQRDVVAQRAIVNNQDRLYRDADDPVIGNPDGDVAVVEFSDYQCPYCKRAHLSVKAVLADDPKVKLIYKDLPILGEASRIASQAALASRKQGKHLELHNALMEHTGKLDRETIFQIAGSVGIDIARLQEDMDHPSIREAIERNSALAAELGVRGTPAFVIGDQFVPGAVDTDTLRQMIADTRRRK